MTFFHPFKLLLSLVLIYTFSTVSTANSGTIAQSGTTVTLTGAAFPNDLVRQYLNQVVIMNPFILKDLRESDMSLEQEMLSGVTMVMLQMVYIKTNLKLIVHQLIYWQRLLDQVILDLRILMVTVLLIRMIEQSLVHIIQIIFGELQTG